LITVIVKHDEEVLPVSIYWYREQYTWTVISEGSGQNIERAAALINLEEDIAVLHSSASFDTAAAAVIVY